MSRTKSPSNSVTQRYSAEELDRIRDRFHETGKISEGEWQAIYSRRTYSEIDFAAPRKRGDFQNWREALSDFVSKLLCDVGLHKWTWTLKKPTHEWCDRENCDATRDVSNIKQRW